MLTAARYTHRHLARVGGSMYRIRLTTGQEQVYPSIQELTAGVHRGEVTADAHIYHQRTERWLPIESHPHYRMALEGGTATRTSRLKFTRPSSPSAASPVLPTPAAQKPQQGDLDELNRLLVLLDPLPTSAQHADPPAPAPVPPVLTVLRPDPAPAAPKPGPDFGTMLRLEDLGPIPEREAPPAAPPKLEVIRDERVVEEPEAPEPVLIEPAPTRLEDLPEVAPADLGVPVEIVLDEIPEAPEPAAPSAAFAAYITPPAEPVVEAPAVVVPAVHEPVVPVAIDPAPFEAAHATDAGHPAEAHATHPARRRRPMLFVASAALIALAVFAFTSRGSDPDRGVVTPAFATPAPTTQPAAGAPSTDSQPAVQSVGIPMPSKTIAPTPDPSEDSSDGVGAAPVLPSAPVIGLEAGAVQVGSASAPVSTDRGATLARSYAASYATLRAEFASQIARSGLVRLFGQTQLSTADGLAGARRALDAASDAVRQYHASEGVIERAFQDSARTLERSGAGAKELRDWMTHPVQKESQEAAGEGTRLLGQIDAVFALLQSQSGKYRVEGTRIRFDDPDAAARYADLQSWITRRLEHWSGQPTSSVPTTVEPVLDGVGLTRLPTTK